MDQATGNNSRLLPEGKELTWHRWFEPAAEFYTLTDKARAANRHVRIHKDLGDFLVAAKPVMFMPEVRKVVEDLVENLLCLLDETDGDPDLQEDNEDCCAAHDDDLRWRPSSHCAYDDEEGEPDCDDEDDGDCEPDRDGEGVSEVEIEHLTPLVTLVSRKEAHHG